MSYQPDDSQEFDKFDEFSESEFETGLENDLMESEESVDSTSAPQKKEKRKLPPRGFLPVFVSVILCFLMVVLMIPTILLYEARNIVDEDFILSVLEEINLKEVTSDAVSNVVDIDTYDEDDMVEWVSNALNEALENNELSEYIQIDEFSPELVEDLIYDTTLLDFISEHTAGFCSDLLTGENSHSIEAKDIESFLKKNKEFLEEEFNMDLSTEARKEIAESIFVAMDVEEISVKELMGSSAKSLESTMELVNMVLSAYVFLPLLLTLLLLLVGLFLVNRKQLSGAVHDAGITFMIGSLLLLILTGVLRVLPSVYAETDFILYLVGVVGSKILETGFVLTIGIFATGLVMTIGTIIYRAIYESNSPIFISFR